jgi:hypothetical protein
MHHHDSGEYTHTHSSIHGGSGPQQHHHSSSDANHESLSQTSSSTSGGESHAHESTADHHPSRPTHHEIDHIVNAYSIANTNVDISDIIAEQKTKDVLSSNALVQTLRILERAVQQNVYHSRHLRYRNFPLLQRDPYVTHQDHHHHQDNHPSREGMTRESVSIVARQLSPPPTTTTMMTTTTTTMTNMMAEASGQTRIPRSTPHLNDIETLPPGTIVRSTHRRLELEKLWGFSCELTHGRTVSSVVHNITIESLVSFGFWFSPTD